MGNFNEAIEWYNLALKYDSSYADAAFNKARILAE